MESHCASSRCRSDDARLKHIVPTFLGRSMENQTKRELERALLLKLREAVNSKEEYEWVEAELALLDSPQAGGAA